MSQAGTIAWFAVRELWMTFRLFLVLAGWVAAGSIVGIVPGPPATTLARLAIGMAAATILGAVVAAWSLAEERSSGRAGWLVTRSVARGTYLVGWFAGLGGVVLVGLAIAGTLGWLAVAPTELPGQLSLAACVVAVGATAVAAIALGLLAGALVRAALAIAMTLAVSAGLAVGALFAGDRLPGLPGTAHLLLATSGLDAIAGDALRAAGVALAVAAIVLAVARVALERSEL